MTSLSRRSFVTGGTAAAIAAPGESEEAYLFASDPGPVVFGDLEVLTAGHPRQSVQRVQVTVRATDIHDALIDDRRRQDRSD